MFNLQDLNKDERSLLLYIETCAVDNNLKLDTRKLNDADWKILEIWKVMGFINHGRIRFKSIKNPFQTQWVELSDPAWELAHKERRERANRMLRNYPVEKTEI